MLISFEPFILPPGYPPVHAHNPHANAQALRTHIALASTHAPTCTHHWIDSKLHMCRRFLHAVRVQTGATKDLLKDAPNMAVCGIYDGGASGLFTGQLSDIKVSACRCAL